MPLSSQLSLSERWSEDHFQEMARLWDLSYEDQAKMRQLQSNIADLDHWKNDPFEVMRYYHQYKGHLPKVEKMFRHMVQWRLENDMETYLDRYCDPDPLWRQLPCAMMETTDREGDPILVDRVGVADSWGLYSHFGPDAFIDYAVFIRELLSNPAFWNPYQKQAGHRVRQFNLIIDLDDLNTGPLKPGLIRMFQKVSRILQDCYAGWEKRVFVIRAPYMFKFIWNIVQHFFDQQRRDSIIFATKSDYLQVLEQYFELKDLPAILAPREGKAKGYPIYFHQVSLRGRPLRVEGDDNQELSKPPSAIIALQDFVTMTSTASSSSTSESSDSNSNGRSVNVSAKVMAEGMWEPNGVSTTISCLFHR